MQAVPKHVTLWNINRERSATVREANLYVEKCQK